MYSPTRPRRRRSFHPPAEPPWAPEARSPSPFASLSLEASGAATFSETRPVSPPQRSVATTFQVAVSSTATTDRPLILTARAQDTAGNPASSAITLRIRDLVPPSVTLAVVGGATTVTAGKSVTVRATATDNVAVAAVDFQASGAVIDSRSVTVVPTPTATADFTITVPAAARSEERRVGK